MTRPAPGSLHHIELWVPSLARARAEWGWLLGREHRDRHELDLVVSDEPEAGRVIAIGEARAAMTPPHTRELRRLEHLRGLLPSARVERPPKLLLFGRGGFSAELTAEAATRPDVELVDLDRLYGGS